MRTLLLTMTMLVAASAAATAQSYKFDLTGGKAKEGYTAVTVDSKFDQSVGYGYDFGMPYDGKSNAPAFFSINVPDGNYKVTVTLGSKDRTGSTTVRGEARRMYHHNVATKKGELKTVEFIVNKHSPVIKGNDKVKIKDREKSSMSWDDKLTLEFNGSAPAVSYIEIEPAPNVPTIFLCGDSTVVDNDAEPYTGWGQMLPLFFDSNVCVANYAESGLSANTFLSGKRLDKALTQMKKGDYVIVEFGHNDQKQKGPGIGAYYSYSFYLKQFIDQARLKGATPILVTPTRRRQYGSDGKVKDTHEDYPQAMRDVAAREGIAVVDFQDLTKTLIDALGEENSKKLFVHAPMGTYEGQEKELKDNTHFSNFGAYQVSKCFIEGIRQLNLDIVKNVRPEHGGYDPANPDSFEQFDYQMSPFVLTTKPKGS